MVRGRIRSGSLMPWEQAFDDGDSRATADNKIAKPPTVSVDDRHIATARCNRRPRVFAMADNSNALRSDGLRPPSSAAGGASIAGKIALDRTPAAIGVVARNLAPLDP